MLLEKISSNLNTVASESERTLSGLAPLAVVLIGAVLRLYHLGYRSIYYDEANQYFESLKPLLLIKDPGNLPLSHYLQHFMMSFGHSETVLRIAPAIFGIGTIIVVYHLGKILFDKQTGLMSALFVSISPFLVYYSQEARSYSQYVFLATLSLLFLLRISKKALFTRYLGYFIVTILCLYTHIFAVCLLVGQNIYMLLLWKRERFNFKPWMITQTLILFSYVPAIMFMVETIQHRPPVDYSITKTIAGIFYVFAFGRLLLPINLNIILIAIGAIFFGICIISGLKELLEKNNSASLFFYSFAITLVFVLIANYRFRALNQEDIRYLIFLTPLFYMLIARGVARISHLKLKNYTLMFILFTCAASLYPYYFKWDTLGKGNFRSAAAFIKKQGVDADDLILCSNASTCEVMRYYLNNNANYKEIGDNHSLLDLHDTPRKIVFVGFTDRTALDFIRSGTINVDPWQEAGYQTRLLQNGYVQSAKEYWPGKNRIDACVYEKPDS